MPVNASLITLDGEEPHSGFEMIEQEHHSSRQSQSHPPWKRKIRDACLQWTAVRSIKAISKRWAIIKKRRRPRQNGRSQDGSRVNALALKLTANKNEMNIRLHRFGPFINETNLPASDFWQYCYRKEGHLKIHRLLQRRITFQSNKSTFFMVFSLVKESLLEKWPSIWSSWLT